VDQPTLAEEVRRLADEVRRLADAQQTYVTREILELKLAGVLKDQEDLERAHAAQAERLTHLSRTVWSAVVAPVIVGIFLYVLLGKS
jgi:hypothetical protein